MRDNHKTEICDFRSPGFTRVNFAFRRAKDSSDAARSPGVIHSKSSTYHQQASARHPIGQCLYKIPLHLAITYSILGPATIQQFRLQAKWYECAAVIYQGAEGQRHNDASSMDADAASAPHHVLHGWQPQQE